MPSDIQMEVDFRDFGTQLARLAAASRRTCQEVVEQQSRLVIVDLMKSTPPTGNRPLYEGWNFQHKKGQQTIDRDMGRLFQPLSSIQAVMYPTSANAHSKNERKLYLKQLAERGDWHGLSEALFAMKVTDERVEIQPTLEIDDYRATRKLFMSGHGGVPARRARKRLVWDSSALEKVRDELHHLVGWAKAGWMAAGRKLEVKRVPKWITDHDAPGSFEDDLHNVDHPAFTVINQVSYIAYLNNGNRLLVRMMHYRQSEIEKSIEKATERFVEDFNNA